MIFQVGMCQNPGSKWVHPAKDMFLEHSMGGCGPKDSEKNIGNKDSHELQGFPVKSHIYGTIFGCHAEVNN